MPATIAIVGNLGRDPETRYTPNGRMNVQFTVAVNHRGRDASGNPVDKTNWFRVTAWGNQAETLDRLAQQGWLTKGRQVFVAGRFEAREYQDNTGATRTSLDITANEVSLVGGRGDGESGGGSFGGNAGDRQFGAAGRASASGNQPSDFDDLPDSPSDVDDIPF